MNRLQKIQLKQSETRQTVAGLLDLETRSTEQDDELKKATLELRRLEGDYQAALAIDGPEAEPEQRDDGDSEDREKRSLLGRTKLAGYIQAAVNGKTPSGAEAEASEAFNCPGMVPLELFETRSGTDGLETRAVTPAPSTTGQSLASPVPALFESSLAAFLQIDMPSVPAGTPAYPIVSTNLTGGMRGKGAAAAETAGAMTVSTASPRRLTGAFRIQREDLAVLPSLETALRQNLGRVLSDSLDNELLNGNNTAPNLNGLFAQLTAPGDPGQEETFASYALKLTAQVDGLFATQRTDIRILMGRESYAHAASVFATNADDTSSLDYLIRIGGGVRVTRRIADAASSIQAGIVRKTNPSSDRVAIAPVWSGLELIRDAVSSASTGEIVVTGVALVGGVVLLRGGVFASIKVHVGT